MEVILIFTDWDSMYKYCSHKLSWVPLHRPLRLIPVSDTKCFVVVYHGLQDFTALVELIQSHYRHKSYLFYVLHHQYPNADTLELLLSTLQQIGKCKLPFSHFEHGRESPYMLLEEVDDNIEVPVLLEPIFDKFKQLLHRNPIEDAKLRLLHKCLDLDIAVNCSLPAILGDYHGDFNDFKDGLDQTNLTEKLTNLRDALL